jgi:hypothetical protein
MAYSTVSAPLAILAIAFEIQQFHFKNPTKNKYDIMIDLYTSALFFPCSNTIKSANSSMCVCNKLWKRNKD